MNIKDLIDELIEILGRDEVEGWIYMYDEDKQVTTDYDTFTDDEWDRLSHDIAYLINLKIIEPIFTYVYKREFDKWIDLQVSDLYNLSTGDDFIYIVPDRLKPFHQFCLDNLDEDEYRPKFVIKTLHVREDEISDRLYTYISTWFDTNKPVHPSLTKQVIKDKVLIDKEELDKIISDIMKE